MRVINDLGKFRTAVLWKNEFPFLYFEDEDSIQRSSIRLDNAATAKENRLAIELKLPRNSSYYALLGVEYKPNTTSELEVRVNFNNMKEDIYQSDLAINEVIYLGIPSEYANSILMSALESIIDSKWKYAGVLSFSIGAHSKVGSSESIFYRITKVLMALLSQVVSMEPAVDDKILIQVELDKQY